MLIETLQDWIVWPLGFVPYVLGLSFAVLVISGAVPSTWAPRMTVCARSLVWCGILILLAGLLTYAFNLPAVPSRWSFLSAFFSALFALLGVVVDQLIRVSTRTALQQARAQSAITAALTTHRQHKQAQGQYGPPGPDETVVATSVIDRIHRATPAARDGEIERILNAARLDGPEREQWKAYLSDLSGRPVPTTAAQVQASCVQ